MGRLAAAVRRHDPKAEIVSLARPIDPWFAARAMIRRRSGETVYLEIDPWRATVQGETPWVNARRVLRELHRHLMLPMQWGLPLVGFVSLVLLGSVMTGLVAYKKFWRGFLRVPRWRLGRSGELRRFVGELHRFTALWSLWFALLIGVTGAWYLVEHFGAQAPNLPSPKVGTAGWDPEGRLDRAVAIATAAQPDLRIRNIQFPFAGDPGLIVEGQAAALLVRDRANAVFIDPETRRVLLSARGEQLGLHQRVSEAADPLHFGTWGGLASKAAWFVFGLVLTSLSATGVMIYALRLKKAERSEGRRRSALRRWWDGMGPFAYIGVATLLLAAWYAPAALGG